MSNVSFEVRSAVEDFLFLEADCMDLHRYDEWFSLWSEELNYWVPCNEDGSDPKRHVSLIFDDRKRLEERIFRLKSKFNHSQSPASRLSRVVSNIRIKQCADTSTLEVSSTFCLTEARGDSVTFWAGRQTHFLEAKNSNFKIKEKRIFLVNNDLVLGNLTFLI
ncbi:aromatic-ring-hydroxylating dioxygenase subunit beta [Ferribacterium limneticum]|uniref:aromatic-ring-hydroxylating dioxygenase subunit beta n=1 Tax=Ferribacterium limneticum TaxID=76259 RepID=UPI001CFA8CB9|nr:aromatic-ring-hydroxylating dioxygenase subunit beta [Ferribacterium limneticum]UCV17752.1 aromatic-ring-hydroxylating dioxygenase subunit beta [Ferribacterium limneticum]